MPYLFEIDEARDERPLALERTCMSCGASEVGIVDSGGEELIVGFCHKYEMFMNEEELNEDQRGEYCWV